MYRKCPIFTQFNTICGFRCPGGGGCLRLYPMQITLFVNTVIHQYSRPVPKTTVQRRGGHARCWPSQVTSQLWDLAVLDPGPDSYSGLFLSYVFSSHSFSCPTSSYAAFICLCPAQCGFVILHEPRLGGRRGLLCFSPLLDPTEQHRFLLRFFPNESATRRPEGKRSR